MRNAILVAFAATLFFTVVAVGQQQNLLIDLSVEPQRSEPALSLYEAAAANDFPRFVALYREKPVAGYEELHRLWTWSMEDPIGAFYGHERYQQLANLYPGYGAYIAQYRIIDSHGNAFYPSAETRRFLLSEAVLGTTPVRREAPIRVAEAAAVPAPVIERKNDVASITTVGRNAPVTSSVAVAAPSTAPAMAVTAPPAVTIAPITTVAPFVPVIAAADPEPVRGVVRRNEADRGALSRSILLIIAGLIGVGMLTLMLQAPSDEDRNLTHHAP